MNKDNNHILRKLLQDANNIKCDFEEFREVYKELLKIDASSKTAVLQAHLTIEYFMNKYLVAANPASPKIGSAKLSFSQKIDLVEHPKVNFEFLLPGVRKLNKLRNQIAHNLEYVVKEEDLQPIQDCLRDWRLAGGYAVPEGLEIISVFTETICAFFHGDTKMIKRHGDGNGLMGLVGWWNKGDEA